EGNPFFQFMRMGRQVDVSLLEDHLRDTARKQISWSYAGHNNPFFESLAGSNYSHRRHSAGAGSLTYSLTPSLSATGRGGVDSYTDDRQFIVPTGWMGGFPFFAGTGDFSRGGTQVDAISVQQGSAGVRLDGKRTLSNGTRWTIGGGLDVQS